MKPPLISYRLQIMPSEENSVMTADGRQLPKNYVNRKQSMHGQDYHEDVASKQSFFFVIDTVRLWCIPPSPPPICMFVSGTLYEWNYILGISHVLTHRCIIKLVRQYSSF